MPGFVGDGTARFACIGHDDPPFNLIEVSGFSVHRPGVDCLNIILMIYYLKPLPIPESGSARRYYNRLNQSSMIGKYAYQKMKSQGRRPGTPNHIFLIYNKPKYNSLPIKSPLINSKFQAPNFKQIPMTKIQNLKHMIHQLLCQMPLSPAARRLRVDFLKPRRVFWSLDIEI
jgi:hypothetical protein